MSFAELFTENARKDMRTFIRRAIQSGFLDAVEVVRCKDCKHKPSGTGVNHDIEFPDEVCPCQCDDYWYSWMPEDNWYCADGERREDE